MGAMGQTDRTGFHHAHGAGGAIEDMPGQLGGFQVSDHRTQGGFTTSGGGAPDRCISELPGDCRRHFTVKALADHNQPVTQITEKIKKKN